MNAHDFTQAHGDSAGWTTADIEAQQNFAAIDAHTLRQFQQRMHDASEQVYASLDGARPIDVHAALLAAHTDTSA